MLYGGSKIVFHSYARNVVNTMIVILFSKYSNCILLKEIGYGIFLCV